MKKNKTIGVWVNKDVVDALEQEAKRRKVSLADLLRQQIAEMKKSKKQEGK